MGPSSTPVNALSVSYVEPVTLRSAIAGAISAGYRLVVRGLPYPGPDGGASVVADELVRPPLGAGSRCLREDR